MLPLPAVANSGLDSQASSAGHAGIKVIGEIRAGNDSSHEHNLAEGNPSPLPNAKYYALEAEIILRDARREERK